MDGVAATVAEAGDVVSWRVGDGMPPRLRPEGTTYSAPPKRTLPLAMDRWEVRGDGGARNGSPAVCTTQRNATRHSPKY